MQRVMQFLLFRASSAGAGAALLLLIVCSAAVLFGSIPRVGALREPPPPSSSQSSRPPSLANRAIVDGGGPAGLSAALVLARHHGFHVQVLEAASEQVAKSFDRNKAYLYNVNMRGQVLTKRLPSVQQAMEARGVGVFKFERFTIPGDPSEVFTNVPFSRSISEAEMKRMGTLYWIPRHEFVQILLDEVATEPNIELYFGVGCERVLPTSNDGEYSLEAKCVRAVDGTIAPQSFHANLVVGADGIHSKVRSSLAETPSLFSKWKHASPRRFRLQKWKSPSTGLRIKTLQIESNFTIPVGDGTSVPFNGTANYVIESINSGWTNQISLTLLPMRNATATRPSAVCTLPTHDIWSICNGEDMRQFFVNAFPRFSFDAGGDNQLVSDDEWDRFAKSEGSRFPPCQYSPGLVATRGDGSGIVLVGDAAHSFPPDLGQGVNAALGDVAVLDDSLYAHDSLSDALEAYENKRCPESRALIRLARFGAPFQYQQSSPLMLVRRYLWTTNLAIRMLLNKLSYGLVPKPAILLMMDPNLSFQAVMRRADTVTVSFITFLAIMMWKAVQRLMFS